MLGLKEKRRMVRNPFMHNFNQYPYQAIHQQAYQLPQMHTPYNNIPYPMQQNSYHQTPPYYSGSAPFYMPYPNQKNPIMKPGPSGMETILGQFKNKEGGYDLNKVMNTAGQMMNTVNQLSGLVKQVGGIFKVKV